MAFTPHSTNVIEVRFHYNVNLQHCINVLHYRAETVYNYTNEDEMVNDLLDAVTAVGNGTIIGEMSDLMSNEATFFQVDGQLIFPAPRRRAVQRTVAISGAVAVPCNAQNVQASVQKFGPNANRSSIGAFHLGGLADTVYENGYMTGAALTNLNQLANVLQANQPSGVDPVNTIYRPVILNKTKTVVEGKDKFVISGGTYIKGCIAKDTLRVMRRRTVRVGI